jgi:uncharacterized protein (DUF362 family)
MLEVHDVQHYDRSALRILFASRLLASGLLERLRARGSSVLLKPNFVMPAPPEDPSTTHPDFYMALAQVLLDEGFLVGIGESPAFGSCSAALKAHGVLAECQERGIAVVEFAKTSEVQGVADSRAYATLTVAAELSHWDSVINLPKVKTHRQFTFTGATKNLYGCVVGKRKFIRHNRCGNDPVAFARMILANAAAIGCVAHVGDGIEAMHVMGPRGGQPYALEKVLIADEPLVHDLAMCHLIGLNPQSTPLFQALDSGVLERLQGETAPVLKDLPAMDDFVHAPLIHISFGPVALARSALRTLRYKLAG